MALSSASGTRSCSIYILEKTFAATPWFFGSQPIVDVPLWFGCAPEPGPQPRFAVVKERVTSCICALSVSNYAKMWQAVVPVLDRSFATDDEMDPLLRTGMPTNVVLFSFASKKSRLFFEIHHQERWSSLQFLILWS